jgi:multisubunit Na+/H+ antiporter MnhE subunit
MLRRVGGWVAVFAVGLATWLLFVLSLDLAEVVAGVLAAATALLAVMVVHRYDPVRLALAPVPRWLLGGWRIPWQVVTDTCRLGAALWRLAAGRQPVRSRFRTVPFTADESEAVGTMRRTIVTVLVSLTPNTYVVGIEGDRALVHQLLPDPADPIPPSLLAPVGWDIRPPSVETGP